MDAPINLAQRSMLEKHIHIERRENYKIEFRFARDSDPFENRREFEKLKELVGAMRLCPVGAPCSRGIAIPVRWSLQNDDRKVIAGEEILTIESSGWSASEVARRIGDFTIDPGRYLFKMEILKDVPELAFLKTRVIIYHPAK